MAETTETMLLRKIKGWRTVEFLGCVTLMAGVRGNRTGREAI